MNDRDAVAGTIGFGGDANPFAFGHAGQMKADVDIGEAPFAPIDVARGAAAEIGGHRELDEGGDGDAPHDLSRDARPDDARADDFEPARFEPRPDDMPHRRPLAIEAGKPRRRSDERRVGKEWVSKGRSGWAPDH